MSKESAAWLAIRIIGLLLLGKALLFVYDIAAQLVSLFELSRIDGSLAAEAEHQKMRAWVYAGVGLAQAIAVGSLSFYFLRCGNAVHNWLIREAA